MRKGSTPLTGLLTLAPSEPARSTSVSHALVVVTLLQAAPLAAGSLPAAWLAMLLLLLVLRGEDSTRRRQMVWLRLLASLKAVLATWRAGCRQDTPHTYAHSNARPGQTQRAVCRLVGCAAAAGTPN